MAKRLVCAAILVLVSSSLASASGVARAGLQILPIEVTIAMANECGAEASVLEMAAREASGVWSRAGVTVHWVALDALPYRAARSEWLVARCLPGNLLPADAAERHNMPIAAIRFIGSQPTNTVVMSIDNARALLRRDAAEARDLDRRFKYLYNIRLGRMLGRAIAHEIGHFLNESQAHSPRGLMKASHTVTALTSGNLAEFEVR
jgi:hypothetical protein